MGTLNSHGGSDNRSNVVPINLQHPTLRSNSPLLTSSPGSSRSNSPSPMSHHNNLASPDSKHIISRHEEDDVADGDVESDSDQDQDQEQDQPKNYSRTSLKNIDVERSPSCESSPDVPHDLSSRRNDSPSLIVTQKPMFPIMGGKHSAFTTAAPKSDSLQVSKK